MKLIILAVFVVCSRGAKLNRAYLPPNHAQTSGGSSGIFQTPFTGTANNNELRNQGTNYKNEEHFNHNTNDASSFLIEDHYQTNGFGSFDRPERSRAALERNAAILRQVNENNGETYSYAFETENGIVAEENGVATNGVEAQGGFSYTGDDGQVYSVRYTAGRNGFLPEGDHLPTPPPIPEEILKALEQNARDEAAGIYDDGSYNERKYTSSDQTPNFGEIGVSNDIINSSNDDSVVVNSARNPEAFQRGSGFHNVASSFSDNNGITKAYLPPTVQRLPGNRYLAPKFDNSNHRTSFNSRTGYNY